MRPWRIRQLGAANSVWRLSCGLLAVWICNSCDFSQGAEQAIEFNRDIRPILAANCLSCHGPDSAARQADLRLDKRDVAIERHAIVPGDPDASGMIQRILSDDSDKRMPPLETKKSLTDEQKQLLSSWIRGGAEYQPHWSLIPPKRPPLPKVDDAEWVRNPIDNFVFARLAAAGLSPAPEADRRTLARRLSLDVTGLPPSPELVDAFIADEAPNAYERLVDKLLASPRWGEHRGRYWLDAARYADTHGIHFDNYREMWSYRDWVINAFSNNMPFDEFTVENLAGDLLPNATLDQQIGSGFNRCNITTNEGGAIEEEYLVLYARDRVETTCQAWMGLTAGCAVCHDHKFDPLSQREFYELAAFFNNTTQAAMDGNIKDTPPVVVVPREEDQPRWNELAEVTPDARKQLDDRRKEARPEFETWLAQTKPENVSVEVSTADLELLIPFNEGTGTIGYELRGKHAEATLPSTVEWKPGRLAANAAYLNKGAAIALPDAGDFDAKQPFTVSAWVKLPANDSNGAIVARMNDDKNYIGWDLWVEGRRIGTHIIHDWPDNAVKVLTQRQLPADEWVHVAIAYEGTSNAAGVHVYVNGELQPTKTETDALTGSIHTEVPFKVGQRHRGSPISGTTIQDVRVYARPLDETEIKSIENLALFHVLATPPGERTPADVDALYSWYLLSQDDEYTKLNNSLTALVREQDEIKKRGTIAHVMHEKPDAAMAYVLNRGEYDQRRDQVSPGTPAALPPFPADLPHDRLGLAKWLLQPEHPLTARVAVNRFWSEVFGTGLVKTAGDFGVSGELPSNPELLDWLAVEFRESGWDVKHLFRLIVTSTTYRQSAAVTQEKVEKDPDNRLLSRGPRFRMDAEMVRDYATAASGLLSDRIGGPSVKPYQPPGVWEAVAMRESGTRKYVQDTGDALHRRSMYTFWKRAAPPASMDIFNAPSREVCTMVRDRTNTPLQALVTLNDPQFIEAARTLAASAIQMKVSDVDRIQFVAERLLARPLRTEELEVVRRSLRKLNDHYSAAAEDAIKLVQVGDSPPIESIPPAELAAWTMVTNELMNLDEVLNK